jgi:hypothetical protein
MAATITVTEADRGTEIQTNGILGKVTLTAVPTSYDPSEHFCLVADGDVKFNQNISTSYKSAGSILMQDENIQFTSLVLQDIPAGASFDLDFVDPPVLTSLNPATAASTDPDFELHCIGTGFTSRSRIQFGAHPLQDEPTTFNSSTDVSTIVKPSLFAPAVIPVSVRNGLVWSGEVDFTMT